MLEDFVRLAKFCGRLLSERRNLCEALAQLPRFGESREYVKWSDVMTLALTPKG